MVRYRGPRVRIIRRLGLLPGLTKKSAKTRTKTPGQHGKIVFPVIPLAHHYQMITEKDYLKNKNYVSIME